MYKAILEDEPAYVDATLRLSILARDRGDLKRALDYAEQARNNHVKKPGNPMPTNIICYKASLYSQAGMLNEALQEFD